VHDEGAKIAILIVGAKCDLEHERQVSCVEGAMYARSVDAFFIETSAKTGKKIEKAFLGTQLFSSRSGN